jgi:hypothetical protein
MIPFEGNWQYHRATRSAGSCISDSELAEKARLSFNSET